MEDQSTISGWKTKYGAIAVFIGAMLSYSASILPTDAKVLYEWVDFLAHLFTYGGGLLAGVGVVHKFEKAGILKSPRYKIYDQEGRQIKNAKLVTFK
jgi:hypothetical protein